MNSVHLYGWLAALLITGCATMDEATTALDEGLRLAPSALEPPDSDLDWVIVDAAGSGDYLHPEEALDAGERRIQILAGEYVLDGPLTITEEDVWMVGEDADAVVLVQADPNADGLRIYADGAHLSGVTIDAMTAKAQAALVLGDVDDTVVTDSRFLGSTKRWAVYAAGPEHTAGTLDDLTATSALNTNNVIARNEIQSGHAGDAMVFAGQQEGLVEDNVIDGTLNIFLCRDSTVIDNWIADAPGPGLTINLPSFDLTVERNTIRDSAASGIRIGPQDIHPVDVTTRSPGLALLDNVVVNSGLFGIEVDGASDLTVQGNLIDSSFYDGVYLLRSDRSLITDNTIQDSALCAALSSAFEWSCDGIAAVFLQEEVIETAIESNTLANVSGLASHAVRAEADSGNVSTFVDGNVLLGEFEDGDYLL